MGEKRCQASCGARGSRAKSARPRVASSSSISARRPLGAEPDAGNGNDRLAIASECRVSASDIGSDGDARRSSGSWLDEGRGKRPRCPLSANGLLPTWAKTKLIFLLVRRLRVLEGARKASHRTIPGSESRDRIARVENRLQSPSRSSKFSLTGLACRSTAETGPSSMRTVVALSC